MSVYTTQVRYICETACGLDESKGFNNVNDIISQARTSIFNFTYPIFDEAYRSVLETKILKHFYTREIGLETVGLWKLKLDTKLNEIMPYYNKLYESELLVFNPLYGMDYTKSHQGTRNDAGTVQSTTSNNNTRTGSYTEQHSNTNNDTELYSDTPQGGIQGLNENGYLTNATKRNGGDSGDGSGTNTENVQGSVGVNGENTLESMDEYTDRVYGYMGYSPSKLIKDFRDSFLNIDMMVLNDLEVLFMQLW